MSRSTEHERVRRLFEAACDLPRREQAAFVESRCGGDQQLRDEVLSLLEFDGEDAGATLTEAHIERGVLLASLLSDRGEIEQIGDYRVVRHIGVGGMGDVYEVEQQSPKRRVAIKIIRPEIGAGRSARRFAREIDIQARLKHPAIAQIFESGLAVIAGREVPFFVMELVEGLSLTRYAEQNALSIEQRVELMIDLCEAIEYAHARGVVHRDLKPDNILVEAHRAKPQIKVLDFGVAKRSAIETDQATEHTQMGQLFGTLPYMSPEQVEGKTDAIGPRSDVYALGAVLFELVAGTKAFDLRGRTFSEAIRIIREDDPATVGGAASGIARDLETIILKAMEKEPDRRYSSAADLAADLRRFLDDVPICARPPSAFYQLSKFARRNRVLVGGVAATMLALAGGMVATTAFAVSAVRSQRQTVWESYRATIAAAAGAIQVNEPATARRALDDAPVANRGWEWRYLNARLSAWTGRIGNGRLVDAGVDQAAREVVVLSADGDLEVWDPVDSSMISSLVPQISLQLIADTVVDSLAACVTGEGEVVLISTLDGSVTRSMDGSVGFWTGVLQSADGSRVVAHDYANVAVWNASDGSLVATLPLTSASDNEGQVEAAVDHDGTQVAVCWDWRGMNRRAGVFNLETGEFFATNSMEGPIAPAFSPDGRYLALTMLQRAIHVFSMDRLGDGAAEKIAVWQGHDTSVTDATFLGDGRLASFSKGTVYVRDPEAGKARVAVLAPTDAQLRLIPVGASGLLTLSEQEGEGLLWNMKDLAATVLNHDRYVYHIAWSPDSRRLASAEFTARNIRIWDVRTGALALNVTAPVANRPRFFFTADGEQLLTSVARVRRKSQTDSFSTSDGSLIRSDIPDAMLAEVAGYRAGLEPSSIDEFSPDGSVRVLRSRFGSDSDWRIIRDGKEVTIPEPSTGFRTIAWHCSGDWFVLGRNRGGLSIRDGETAQETRQVPLPSALYSLDLSPDGTRLAAGCEDGVLRLYDTRRWEIVLELPAHDSYIFRVRFSPDGTMLATASGDATVKIWDSLTRAEREALP